MTNITLLTSEPRFQYDWELIEDVQKRERVKTEVQAYQREFETNRRSAEQIIVKDTIAKANTVSRIKEELSHGQFIDVCKQSLNLNRDQASSYVSIAKNILSGATSEDVMAMVRQMEPVAANKLLKADEQTQKVFVDKYQETGRVPSNRSFFERAHSQKRMQENVERQQAEAFSHDYEQASEPVQPVITSKPESAPSLMADTITITAKPTETVELLKSVLKDIDHLRTKCNTSSPEAQLELKRIHAGVEHMLGLQVMRRWFIFIHPPYSKNEHPTFFIWNYGNTDANGWAAWTTSLVYEERDYSSLYDQPMGRATCSTSTLRRLGDC